MDRRLTDILMDGGGTLPNRFFYAQVGDVQLRGHEFDIWVASPLNDPECVRLDERRLAREWRTRYELLAICAWQACVT